MIDVFTLPYFLGDLRDEVLRDMAAAPGVEAGVYASGTEAIVNRRVRSARALSVGSDVRGLFDTLLTDA